MSSVPQNIGTASGLNSGPAPTNSFVGMLFMAGAAIFILYKLAKW